MPGLNQKDPCAGHATRVGDVRLSKAEPLASLTDREPEMRRSTGLPSVAHARGSSTTALISDLSADDPALSQTGRGQCAGARRAEHRPPTCARRKPRRSRRSGPSLARPWARNALGKLARRLELP